MTTNLVSIDIGYSNMALVEISTDFKEFTVNNIHKINLSIFSYIKMFFESIPVFTTNTIEVLLFRITQ